MTAETMETVKGTISTLLFEEGESLKTPREFFEAIMEAPTSIVALPQAHMCEDFFNLRTGLAGEVLQKVSTYRRRLIIQGDFKTVESNSLRDFIYESNRTGHVVFVDTLEMGLKLLK